MHKKSILCVVNTFDPYPSANTICVKNLLYALDKKKYNVYYLVLNTNAKVGTSKNVICIDTYIAKYLKKHHEEQWQNVPRSKRLFVALVNKIFHLFKTNTGSNCFDCISDRKIFKVIKDLHIDIMISNSTPFELHVIASKIKNKFNYIKWYPVLFDPFIYNFTFSQEKKQIEKRKRISQRIFKNADKIFYTKGILSENHYNNCVLDYEDKIVEITIPNLVDLTGDDKVVQNEQIQLTFAGMFYNDIRNPKEMINILNQLGQEFKINICGTGCEDQLDKLKNNPLYDLKGKLSRKECLNLLNNSNILINLGNTITNQMPSKVLEYIGMGKPIVNFYFSDKDISLYYLKKYPLCFNLNLNKYTNKDVIKLIEFCKKHYKTRLTFLEATRELVDDRMENISLKFCGIITAEDNYVE